MKLLSGNEPFTYSFRTPPQQKILDFWAWNSSDLLNNTLRGALAEYIVALALNIDLSSPRQDWTEYDLVTKDRTRIEVKCSAYLQSWKQHKLSSIRFTCAPSQAFVNQAYDGDYARHSDIYVFCLFSSRDPQTANPLNLDQWLFYILPTKKLNECLGNQKTLSLSSLIKLAPLQAKFHEISSCVTSLVSSL